MTTSIPSVLPLCNWTLSIAKDDQKRYLDECRKELNICPKWEYYGAIDDAREKTTGDERLEALIQALGRLDEVGFKRSSAQRKFHRAYMGACLRKIYGKDLYRNVGRIMREYELDQLRSDVIVCTPRRWGKTFSVALYVAAYLWSQPGCEVSIYSTGRRASRKILALIWKMVVSLSGTEECVVTFNQETLEIRGPHGKISKCHSYPSKVQINVEENWGLLPQSVQQPGLRRLKKPCCFGPFLPPIPPFNFFYCQSFA